ncbi:MAG: spore coat protein [Veillonellales bacterium]
MTLQLTQKEKNYLEDQKKHEQICIKKYQKYAGQTQDPQLQQLFTALAGSEQQHYNTINQMLSGQVPQLSQQSGSQSQQQAASSAQAGQSAPASQTTGSTGQNEASLCTDMLMTEKFVSGAYDTAIFESANTNVRQALNHIQKEEQEHGEKIYNYMQSNGLYNG